MNRRAFLARAASLLPLPAFIPASSLWLPAERPRVIHRAEDVLLFGEVRFDICDLSDKPLYRLIGKFQEPGLYTTESIPRFKEGERLRLFWSHPVGYPLSLVSNKDNAFVRSVRTYSPGV